MAKNHVQAETGSKWAIEYVHQVGQAMKSARGSMSARELSDRTAELGYRISPQVIARLDSGRRAELLTVPELVVLAEALGVAPLELLFPQGKLMAGLPGVKEAASKSADRFVGVEGTDARSSAYRAGIRDAMQAVQDLLG